VRKTLSACGIVAAREGLMEHVDMKNVLLKGFISVIALACLAARWLLPDISIDKETFMILAIALAPWLSSVVKGVEVLGFKIEFQPENMAEQVSRRDSTDIRAKEPEQRRSGSMGAEVRSETLHPIAADDYLAIALKITPFETIVVFILANAMITTSHSQLLSWINFALVLTLTPLYLRFSAGVLKYSQLIASTIGFAVWVFAIGGPFVGLKWYKPILGALLLVTYAFIAPMLMKKSKR
jgi:hypothetical protein